ncbi:MAG: hypothetical protein HOO67_03005 [Candidatus Peribacteraceae bacterium]|nr:hypothetical protein [Candidatus Peribacteraceae bacterium]
MSTSEVSESVLASAGSGLNTHKMAEVDHGTLRAHEAIQLSLQLSKNVPAEYNPLIAHMRFWPEPHNTWLDHFRSAIFTGESIAECFASKPRRLTMLKLSLLGIELREMMQGGLFIDIPCGHGRAAQYLPALSIARCWEVDLDLYRCNQDIPEPVHVVRDGKYHLENGIHDFRIERVNGVPVTTIQDDLLGFISKINKEEAKEQKTFYLSGLQTDREMCKALPGRTKDSTEIQYFDALCKELASASNSGDLVILNGIYPYITGIDPITELRKHGFSLATQSGIVTVLKKKNKPSQNEEYE